MLKSGTKHLLADKWKSPSLRKRIRSVNPPPQDEEEPHPRDSLEGTSSLTVSYCHKTRRTTVHLCAGRVWWSLRLFFFRTRTVGEMRRLGGGDELAKQQSPEKRVWVCIYQGKVSTSEERKKRGPKKRQYPVLSLSCVVVVCWCVSVSFQASVKCVRYESQPSAGSAGGSAEEERRLSAALKPRDQPLCAHSCTFTLWKQMTAHSSPVSVTCHGF